MKTATIAYRVADFLRRFPPFQCMTQDELIELAGTGRVRFHEDGELVFEAGRPRARYIYVIQQGEVDLLVEGAERERLRDVRGEGDLLGIGRYLGHGTHLYTARTRTDTILYALDADAFWRLVQRYPRARRFLDAYFGVASDPCCPDSDTEKGRELRIGLRPVDWMGRPLVATGEPLSVSADMPIREAARLLDRTGSSALAVLDGQRRPLGVITPRLLSARVATGEIAPHEPAGVVMAALPAIARAGARAGDYLVAMLNGHSEHVVLSEDGTRETPFLGVVSRRDLTRVEGAAPLGIIADIDKAQSPAQLMQLRLQGEGVVGSGLAEPEDVRWLAPIANAFDVAILRRLTRLVEAALEEEGLARDVPRHCWVFFGAAGRAELLTRHDLDHGLVFEYPGRADYREVQGYFLELGRRIASGLAACGYVTTAKGISAGHRSGCRSVGEWEQAFTHWIGQPRESNIYRGTSFFDMRPVQGDCSLVQGLGKRIGEIEEQRPGFVPLLVEDSMANLPPLTFFRGLVVDDSGGYTDVLDLRRAALQPVVDIARARALDRGITSVTSTLERLSLLVAEHPEDEGLLSDAESAFRLALYHRAKAGLATGTDGSQVDPTKLTRLDQNLLKSAFRTVLRLMEDAAVDYGLDKRR